MTYSDAALKAALAGLDEIGIDVVDDATIAKAQAILTQIDQRIRDATEIALKASADPGPDNPSHDTWDDNTWFQVTMARQGVSKMEADRDENLRVLRAENTGDAVASICGLVLHMLHEYIKGALGLTTVNERETRSGSSHFGLPDVYLIWEARNQHQHHLDAAPGNCSMPRYQPGRKAFKALVQGSPNLFNWPGGEPTDNEITQLMHQKSWARESLLALGLTDSRSIRQALPNL